MQSRLRMHSLATALVLGSAIAAPISALAAAPCTRWDISQGWYAIQGDFHIDFQLVQRNTDVGGSATYVINRQTGFFSMGAGRIVHGAVSGAIHGDTIELRTEWGGIYSGKINATGRIDGTTYDKNNSLSSAAWYSDRRMNCLSRAEVPVMGDPGSTRDQGLTFKTKSASAFERPARPPAPAPAPAPIPVSTTPDRIGTVCKTGFVHRLASAADRVCVSPASHQRVVAENRTARFRFQPHGGFYGPNTCRNGFVWREAFVGDLVCVEPAVRTLVRQENTYAARLLTTRERG